MEYTAVLLLLMIGRCTSCLAPLSPGESQWQSTPTDAIDVEWMFGHSTCNSESTCYGVTGDTVMLPQITPIEIQSGQPIRFVPSQKMGISFSLLPLYVNEQGFKHCYEDQGIKVINTRSSQPITVHQRFLPIGSNYFIVKSQDQFMRCDFGLRVNVTVKENRCYGNSDDIICSGRGECVSHVLQTSYTCKCCPGWTGQFCADIDACHSNPCRNGAQCHDVLGDLSGTQFTCSCQLGFYGVRCEQQYRNLCDLNLCQHSTNCTGNSTHYWCTCQQGYTGPQCDTRITTNLCDANPCQHGICVDAYGTYQCYCTPGYGGYQCEIDYNECQSSPCYHGGSCHDDENSYSCVCTSGFTGPRCDTKVNLCSREQCANSGTCMEHEDGYMCVCVAGFTGSRCEVNIDECQSGPCLNEGACHDNDNGYQCMCRAGWKGSHCQHQAKYEPKTSIFNTRGQLSPQVLTVILSTVAIIILASIIAGCFLYWRNTSHCTRNRKIVPFTVHPSAVTKNAIFDTTGDYDESRFNTPLFTDIRPRKV